MNSVLYTLITRLRAILFTVTFTILTFIMIILNRNVKGDGTTSDDTFTVYSSDMRGVEGWVHLVDSPWCWRDRYPGIVKVTTLFGTVNLQLKTKKLHSDKKLHHLRQRTTSSKS